MTPRAAIDCAILGVSLVFPSPQEPLVAPASAPATRRAQLLRMDRLCGLSLCAADALLFSPEVAGRFAAETTAILLGTAYGCHKTDEAYQRDRLSGPPSPRLFAYTLSSSPVGEVSIHHGLLGPGLSIVSGKTAGLEALDEARSLLLSGQARACLVIGCEVAAPAVVERAQDAALCDGAVAILLAAADDGAEAPPGGFFTAAKFAYRAGEPQAALAVVLDELKAQEPRANSSPLVYDSTSPYGAAAALAVFAELPKTEHASCVVLCADAGGQAGAVFWQRSK